MNKSFVLMVGILSLLALDVRADDGATPDCLEQGEARICVNESGLYDGHHVIVEKVLWGRDGEAVVAFKRNPANTYYVRLPLAEIDAQFFRTVESNLPCLTDQVCVGTQGQYLGALNTIQHINTFEGGWIGLYLDYKSPAGMRGGYNRYVQREEFLAAFKPAQ